MEEVYLLNKIKCYYKNPLAYYELAYYLKNYIDENTIIICIGTDRCIGDCLGPLAGTMLKESNFPLPVYGTISDPIHALNIDKKLEKIKNKHPNSTIIGIDACLGDTESIGEIQARDYPIHPGKGVGKELPHVGNFSLIGIVDSNDTDELFTNRSIRLSFVFDLTKVITRSLIHAYHLYSSKNTEVDI